MTRSSLLLLLLVGCDTSEPMDGGAPDAGMEVPPTCADPASVYAFPSPRWIDGERIVVPTDDIAGDAVRALGWEDELSAVAGWPRRPTWIVPLDRDASGVDASEARMRVSDGSGHVALDAPIRVELVSPRTLAVTPRDPLPADAVEVVLGVGDAIAGDAHPLSVAPDTRSS